MITENVVLETDLKKSLQHLSIDNEKYISTMLVEGAQHIIDHDLEIVQSSSDSYLSFTMKIDDELKSDIKTFCSEKNVKIKDFWNYSAYLVIKEGGQFD